MLLPDQTRHNLTGHEMHSSASALLALLCDHTAICWDEMETARLSQLLSVFCWPHSLVCSIFPFLFACLLSLSLFFFFFCFVFVLTNVLCHLQEQLQRDGTDFHQISTFPSSGLRLVFLTQTLLLWPNPSYQTPLRSLNTADSYYCNSGASRSILWWHNSFVPRLS